MWVGLLRLVFPPRGAFCASCNRFRSVALIGPSDAFCEVCAREELKRIVLGPESEHPAVPFKPHLVKNPRRQGAGH